MRGVLMAFQPLLIDWAGSGGGEMRTLAKAEWQGGQPLLRAQACCALLHERTAAALLPREDAHPALFQAYAEALRALAAANPRRWSLRRFELALLQELGYGLTLDRRGGQRPAGGAAKALRYIIERGPVPWAKRRRRIRFRGGPLLDMAQDDFAIPKPWPSASS
jgi:DNA repair protein RecO (recombination protein O)